MMNKVQNVIIMLMRCRLTRDPGGYHGQRRGGAIHVETMNAKVRVVSGLAFSRPENEQSLLFAHK